MKKDEPEEKPEPMEVEEKKPDMKTEPKEEEEGGANSTTSSSPLQSRRKSELMPVGKFGSSRVKFFSLRSYTPNISQCSITYAFIVYRIIVFKPEELRQALMPTLESLYRQDPESLPFRQPVDPMLLGIPVSNTPAPIASNSNRML